MDIKYMDYLWDKMKTTSKKSYIADKIKDKPWFSKLSEQSIYTIAYDLLYYQQFDKGEKICPQSTKS